MHLFREKSRSEKNHTNVLKVNLKEKIALMWYVPVLISFLQFHFQVPSFYFGNVSSVFDSGTTSTHLSSSVLQPYRWYYIITKVTPKATYIISHLQCENATTFEEAPFSHVDAIFWKVNFLPSFSLQSYTSHP